VAFGSRLMECSEGSSGAVVSAVVAAAGLEIFRYRGL
jgi:hypothetical protein